MLESLKTDNINYIEFSRPETQERSGIIRQINHDTWRIRDVINDKEGPEYAETHRTADAIFLFRKNKNQILELNLTQNTILSSYGGSSRKIYSILTSSSKTTGWLVNLIQIGDRPNTVQNEFQQISETIWREKITGGGGEYTYKMIARGEWGIFLQDTERDLRIHLDLHRNIRRSAWGNAPFTDIDKIVRSSAKITGRLVNRIDYSTNSGLEVEGSFRQLTKDTWIQDDLDIGYNLYQFKEVFRGIWAVELFDEKRKLKVRLNLHTGKITLTENGKAPIDQYRVARTFVLPRYGMDNIEILSSLTVRPKIIEGKSHDIYQSGVGTWVENYIADDGSQRERNFKEKARSKDAVYIYNEERDLWLHFDISKRRVTYAKGRKRQRRLYKIRYASFGMNGHTINHLILTNTLQTVGTLRQAGEDLWLEDNVDRGAAVCSYKQISRTLNSVILEDNSRDLTLEISLTENKVYQLKNGTKTLLYRIKNKYHGPEFWDPRLRIVSSSVLTEDYKVSRGEAPVPVPVFRTTIGFSSVVEYVDVWASEEVTITVQNNAHVIDPVKPVRLSPSALSKLSISIPAKSLACPSLLLRTNLMDEVQRHTIIPDIDVHKKLQNLDKGELWKARAELGFDPTLEEHDVDDFQKAVTNIASLATPTYKVTTHGVHHDPTLNTEFMENQNFAIDFSTGTQTFIPIIEKKSAENNNDQHGRGAGQGLFDNPFGFIENTVNTVTRVTVETVDNTTHIAEAAVTEAATEVVSTTRDVVNTVADTTEDVVNTVVNTTEDAANTVINQAETAVNTVNTAVNQVGDAIENTAEEVAEDVVETAKTLARETPAVVDRIIETGEEAVKVAKKIDKEIDNHLGDIPLIGETLLTAKHTAEDIVEGVATTGWQAVKGTVEIATNVTQKLAAGEIDVAFGALADGGLSLIKNTSLGAVSVMVSVSSIPLKVAAMTLELAGKVVKIVIDNTGVVGEAITWILEKAGTVAGKLVSWVLGHFGWNDVIHTHDVILDMMNNRVDEFSKIPEQLIGQSENFFKHLTSGFEHNVQSSLNQFTIPNIDGNNSQAGLPKQVIEKIEWVMDKWADFQSSTSVTFASASHENALEEQRNSPFGEFIKIIEDEFGKDADKVKEVFGDSYDDLYAAISNPVKSPMLFMQAFIDFVKTSFSTSIRIFKKFGDLILKVAKAAFEGLKKQMNEALDIPILSDFYSGLAHGKTLTMASLVSLILAIPTTSIALADDGVRPFNTIGASAGMPTQDNSIKSTAAIYSACHFICIMTDGIDATLRIKGQKKQGSTGKKPLNLEASNWNLMMFNLLVDTALQCCGNPVAPQPHTWKIPPGDSQHDIFEAPNYWSHVVWTLQWTQITINILIDCPTIASSVRNRNNDSEESNWGTGIEIAQAGANSLIGIANLALMSHLSVVDDRKAEAIIKLLNDSRVQDIKAISPNDSKAIAEKMQAIATEDFDHKPYVNVKDMDQIESRDWLNSLELFCRWFEDGANGRKTAGNIFDTFPSVISMFQISPIKSIPVILLTTSTSIISHTIEAGIYTGRIVENELY